MKRRLAYLLTCLTLSSCNVGTKVQYYPLSKQVAPLRTSAVDIVDDVPGRPYKVIGVIAAVGVENTALGGSSQQEAFSALIEEAKNHGGNAITVPRTMNSVGYGGGGSLTEKHNISSSVLIWCDSSENGCTPSTQKASLISDEFESEVAKTFGLPSNKDFNSIKIGVTSKADLIKLFGLPKSQAATTGMFAMESWIYQLDVFDWAQKSHREMVSVTFNADGKVFQVMRTPY